MIIEKWNGIDWWDELAELCKQIEDLDEIYTHFPARVFFCVDYLQCMYFVILSDDRTQLLGYFSVQPKVASLATIYEFSTSKESVVLHGRMAKKVLDFVFKLGFKRVDHFVHIHNTRAIRLYSWLGAKVTHYKFLYTASNEHTV